MYIYVINTRFLLQLPKKFWPGFCYIHIYICIKPICSSLYILATRLDAWRGIGRDGEPLILYYIIDSSDRLSPDPIRCPENESEREGSERNGSGKRAERKRAERKRAERRRARKKREASGNQASEEEASGKEASEREMSEKEAGSERKGSERGRSGKREERKRARKKREASGKEASEREASEKIAEVKHGVKSRIAKTEKKSSGYCYCSAEIHF